jgi:signal transduction histidine kinase
VTPLRRRAPELLVAALILLLLGSYILVTERVVAEFRSDAGRSSRMLSEVYRASSDTSDAAAREALFEIAKGILDAGVPLVLTDAHGAVETHANLPFDPVDDSDPRVKAYVAELDRENAPVVSEVSAIHYGNTPFVHWLRIVPPLQVITALMLLLAGVYIIRTRGSAIREHIWAGMARESAHQLGTPLSSLGGWVELLEDRGGEDPTTVAMAAHMRADLKRLDRVAHRFERIGRDAKPEAVDVTAMVDSIAAYFRARVPTLAHTIAVDVEHHHGALTAQGDPVLLEWAFEVLVKNAVDALAGRGGRIVISTTRLPEQGIRIRVADNGPGIPRELRERVFDPGFSTKSGGWGIGLALARRIVEENHGGSLALVSSDRGATFDVILH